MTKPNLYIAGGCMIAQTGILPTKLFHQTLRKRMEASTHEKISTKLESINEHKELMEKLLQWTEQNPHDTIVIQYRPIFLLRRLKLFIHQKNNKPRFILNPALKSSVFEEHYQDIVDKEYATKKVNYFKREVTEGSTSFKHRLTLSINVYLGSIFLFRKAKKSFGNFIRELDEIAIQRNLNIFYIGVIPTPMLFFDRIITGALNRYLKKQHFKRIVYVNVYPEIIQNLNANFSVNKFHISEKGHSIVSELLYNQIKG